MDPFAYRANPGLRAAAHPDLRYNRRRGHPRYPTEADLMSTDDSTDLVERMKAGDAEALAQFVEARRPQLLTYIQRQLSDGLRRKVDPEDVLQETAAEAVRSLGSIDLSSWDPFGWLCQIAERRIIDAHRRFFGAQKRDASREISINAPGGGADGSRQGIVNLLVASITSPTQALSRKGREFRLLEALKTLPEDQQEALRLRYVENMPSKDIAKRLGKTDGAVRVMLTRSLQKLQGILGEESA
jgi:RNA polymerase sigma-70 factor (ECF subfamily)